METKEQFKDFEILDTETDKLWKLRLESYLDRAKVILTDVFDTVIYRCKEDGTLMNYHEIFEKIQDKVPRLSNSYDKERTAAAREARANKAYYNLDDISRRLPIAMQMLPYFEADIDIQYQRPSVFGHELLTMSRGLPFTPKYFLSDTYYQKFTVSQFIAKCHKPYLLERWNLLVSASDTCAKSDGTMYDNVRHNHPNIQGTDFIMFSDRVEDLELAAKYQIRGILVKTAKFEGNLSTSEY